MFTGAGKVGAENGAGRGRTSSSASRADFFEEEVGLETTLKRPIVNTRDEPHADPQQYRRLHVIAGDANLCEVATFLKVGTTAIVLAMIEDDFVDKDLGDRRAGRTRCAPCRTIPTLRATVELARRRIVTAVELQWEFLRLAQKYADETGLEACGGEVVGGRCSPAGKPSLTRARARPDRARRPARLGHQAVAPRGLPDRDGLDWDDPKLSLLDLQYHDVRPERSLYERLVRAGKVERLVAEDDGRRPR